MFAVYITEKGPMSLTYGKKTPLTVEEKNINNPIEKMDKRHEVAIYQKI